MVVLVTPTSLAVGLPPLPAPPPQAASARKTPPASTVPIQDLRTVISSLRLDGAVTRPTPNIRRGTTSWTCLIWSHRRRDQIGIAHTHGSVLRLSRHRSLASLDPRPGQA